ncbi:MAG: hypothetical protein LUC29_06640 [Acidaminococcaceae bacterium]|nr:hypothetical protein [Acidaminococcaceae bacterium]
MYIRGDVWAADYEKTAGESKVVDNANGSKSIVDFGTGGYTWTTNSGGTI